MDFYFKRTYRGPLKAVILDWAGTTVDYGCFAPVMVFKTVFADAGVAITTTEARTPMGMQKKDHIRAISQMPRVTAAWAEQHGQAPAEADVEAMYEAFRPRQTEVVTEFADLIPGVLDAQADFRARGLKIGSCTGYTRPMMQVLGEKAAAHGYTPDLIVTGEDVTASRPAPWMAIYNAMQFNAYPFESCVKIGDTVADVREGLNAGMWTIAIGKTGNEVGLTLDEVNAMPASDLQRLLDVAHTRLAQAGAHFVVDGLDEVPAMLDEIGALVRAGERP